MQQQITRGDYLKDLITIYIENNLQQELNQLYSQFVFQCGEIQKFLTPAQVIKISFTEQESQLLTNYNTCYLAGITTDGHKETFNGSLSFNTRGEVVYYEPTPNSSVSADTTSSDCPCTGIRGFFANCTQPAIKAYFSLNYVPTKLSELTNDTDFVDSVDVAESISEHNASESAHPYIQSVLADTTEALTVSIQAETTARIDAVSLAISTTEGYTDSIVSVATEATKAYADSITSAATTATEAYADASVSVHNTATNAHPYIQSVLQSATNDLQTQIDGLAAASDVTDIVGTYAELQTYDTQHLNNNDIIKVLSDETHDDEPSYYRFNKTAGTFSYIGSESAAYTKAQSNSIFVAQTTTVNNKPLSSDITLTYSDVDALSETYATVISGNTSDISGLKNLSNLNSNGEARLHALKAYADNGELLTDTDGLSFVKNYAHSTFDRSKFNVVGSPNITDDGIASGFSQNNYLKRSILLATQGHTIKVFGQIKITEKETSGNQFLFKFVDNNSEVFGVFKNTTGAIQSRQGASYKWSTTTANYNINEWLDYEVVFSNNETYLKIYQNGTLIYDLSSAHINFTDFNFEELRFGEYGTNIIYNLRKTIITVDGVPVFSGNKTGIDTIKPVDFNATSNNVSHNNPSLPFSDNGLTITDDGIASGFDSGSNNAIVKQLTISPTQSLKICCKVNISELTPNQRMLFIEDGSNHGANLMINESALRFRTLGSGATVTKTTSITANTTHFIEYEMNNSVWTGKISTDGQNWTTVDVGTVSWVAGAYTVKIGGILSNDSIPFKGSVDLPSVEIFIDGDLVYQPCLKIPYTESKTGSKIVDSLYRNRVNDMAEQFGYANYYTLSDTDFTLPQVELYGLIGQRTLRDSYRNGINYWELYSNRDLEQGGSCTSGVEVTFARPFADTNYVLSVPYSAKSTTAFTPTQTGDWIAKGKGLL